MRRVYALTVATELVVAASTLLVFWIAAWYWEPGLFGEYVLGRRTLGLLHGATSLNLLVSIPRYIAQSRADPATAERTGPYFIAGVILVMAAVGTVGAVFLLTPGLTAAALFGSDSYRSLLGPVYLCLVGIMLHGLAYSYFRGRLQMTGANVLQFLGNGALQMVPFALPGLSPGGALTAVGTGMIALAGGTVVVIAYREAAGISRAELWNRGRELLRYSAPRIPAEFALAALLTLPATLAAHFGGIVQAGYVGFSTSALSLAASFFAPVGLVLLPDATIRVARGEWASLARGLMRLVGVAAALTTAGVVVLELVADPLVRWYLGPQYQPAAAVLRLTMLGALPYVIYVLMRSAVDALTVRALNTRTLLLALASFGAVVAFVPSIKGVAVALSCGLTVAGVLSVRDVLILMRRRVGSRP